jgi:hypothetical protein
LCGRETISVTLKEKHRLGVFEPKREKKSHEVGENNIICTLHQILSGSYQGG